MVDMSRLQGGREDQNEGEGRVAMGRQCNFTSGMVLVLGGVGTTLFDDTEVEEAIGGGGGGGESGVKRVGGGGGSGVEGGGGGGKGVEGGGGGRGGPGI